MVAAVEKHMEQIQALCVRYKMRRVWLFGSALDEKRFQEESDIDFLYEPARELMSIREFLDNPYKIKAELSLLLGKPIDWIRYLPFRNPYFREEVESTKQLIFEYEPKSEEVLI